MFNLLHLYCLIFVIVCDSFSIVLYPRDFYLFWYEGFYMLKFLNVLIEIQRDVPSADHKLVPITEDYFKHVVVAVSGSVRLAVF